jgi:hypothetical protein
MHFLSGWSPPGNWGVELCAPRQDGFLLEIDVDAGAHPRFEVSDWSAGLPVEGPAFLRPPGFIPAEHSDETVVYETRLRNPSTKPVHETVVWKSFEAPELPAH